MELHEIYAAAGSALEQAQHLEEYMALTISMVVVLETGSQRDFTPSQIRDMLRSGSAPFDLRKASAKPLTARKLENLRSEVGQILLLLESGDMGGLLHALRRRLSVSPGGPQAPMLEINEARESRNYLCHRFFKEFGPEELGDPDGRARAMERLEEISGVIADATKFVLSIRGGIAKSFPQTFQESLSRLH